MGEARAKQPRLEIDGLFLDVEKPSLDYVECWGDAHPPTVSR
jgi:hypothetical protein